MPKAAAALAENRVVLHTTAEKDSNKTDCTEPAGPVAVDLVQLIGNCRSESIHKKIHMTSHLPRALSHKADDVVLTGLR